MKPFFVRFIFVLLVSIIAVFAKAKEVINVALTSVQPPFVFDDVGFHGLAKDVITEMNRASDKYHFEIKFYPPTRAVRYNKSYEIDVIAFNDVHWGWHEYGGQGSLSLTNGKDVFFKFKDIRLSETVDKQSIAAVRGFHYAFASYDTQKLAEDPLVTSLENEVQVVEFVSYGRAARGVSSEAYLNWLALSEPALYQRISINEEDHSYNRRFVVMPDSPISVEEINTLLEKLNKTELLRKVFERYGQPGPPLN